MQELRTGKTEVDMTFAMFFWLVFIVAFIVTAIVRRATLSAWVWDSFIFWLLIFLLGVEVFGWPVNG
jgi:hypothetical protein